MNVIFKEMVNCFLLKMKFTNHQKMLITYGAWQQERESRVTDRDKGWKEKRKENKKKEQILLGKPVKAKVCVN